MLLGTIYIIKPDVWDFFQITSIKFYAIFCIGGPLLETWNFQKRQCFYVPIVPTLFAFLTTKKRETSKYTHFFSSPQRGDIL